jgi:hypothetical protein
MTVMPVRPPFRYCSQAVAYVSITPFIGVIGQQVTRDGLIERRDIKDEVSLLPIEKRIAQGISIRENQLSREKNLGSLPQRQKGSVGCLSLPSTLDSLDKISIVTLPC